jgi:hypothetical protein
MHLSVRACLAALTLTLLAGTANALPGVVVDNDAKLILAQNNGQDESRAIEGEEGKVPSSAPQAETPSMGGSAAMAPAEGSAPHSPVNTIEEKGLEEEGR